MDKTVVTCGFCQVSDESPITGPLLKKNEVIVHENCLLYSSGIYSKIHAPDIDDLCGFEEEDVIQEIKRGRLLKCYKCKKTGATVGCEVKKCKKSYHYPCAMTDGAENQEETKKGIFTLYCKNHRQTSAEGSNDNCFNKEKHLKRSSPSGNGSDSGEDILPGFSKKRRCSTPIRDRKTWCFASSDSSDSEKSERVTFDFEQAPVESDFEDTQDVIENKDATFNDKRICKEPRISGAQMTPVKVKVDEKDDMLDPSESCRSCFQITEVHTIHECAPNHSSPPTLSPPHAATPEPSFKAFDFWAKCREADCIEYIFTSFMSSMNSLCGRMKSRSASEEDYLLSYKVLTASGMLPDILAQGIQGLQQKQENLQDEIEAVNTARVAMLKARALLGIFQVEDKA